RSRLRLQLDRLDVLYLHRWDASAETPEALVALDLLVKTGAVGTIGVSNYTFAQLTVAAAVQDRLGLTPFRVVQNNNNYAVREIPPDLRDWCVARGVAIVTYSPLGAGFLTGKHQSAVQPGTRFAVAPGHQDVYFHKEAYERLARLQSLAASTGHSQTHLALAWALHQPGTASVLVGGRTPAHLDQAFAAMSLDSQRLFADLENA
ncbi:MAG TPA: aldo/keto reductase, partial [Prosthecobacter sp.]|nr:aldo/keto reductase [Prosthecobacter sp.]